MNIHFDNIPKKSILLLKKVISKKFDFKVFVDEKNR